MDSDDQSLFDESAYLARYPDVAQALADGSVASGWEHFVSHGRAEGRSGGVFDEAFYLRSYPQARVEMEAGMDARQHYVRYGKARGYLPSPHAQRPVNAAALGSRFGGLWTDFPDALDKVSNRLELGWITQRQADLLERWISDGFVILKAAASDKVVERALADFDKAFSGGFEPLQFECPQVGRGHMRWQAACNVHPSKALDLHFFSQAIRELIFCQGVTEFLELIFESRLFASQTLGFLRGSAQEGHQDSAYVPYSIARQFSASWIALEDVTPGGGELFYYPGSHRFDDFLYDGHFKSVSEMARSGSEQDSRRQVNAHVAQLVAEANRRGMRKQTLLANKGDALIWHADLVHGGSPISALATRKSMVTHYCPKRLTPLFAEYLPIEVFAHEAHRFTSSYYHGRNPE